jgi:hypothetical protein
VSGIVSGIGIETVYIPLDPHPIDPRGEVGVGGSGVQVILPGAGRVTSHLSL